MLVKVTRQQHPVLRQQIQQGLATRQQLQPSQSDSMGQQANDTNTQQNPLIGKQASYSDMLQQDWWYMSKVCHCNEEDKTASKSQENRTCVYC